MSIRRQRNWVYPPDIRGIADVEKHLRKHYTEHVDESVERIKDFVDNISSMDTDDIAEGASNLYFTAERCQDTAGGMFTGNTETFITATYQDGDGTVDLVVPVKDEDNMTSDSDTHLATQQSIKAYVDDSIPTDFYSQSQVDGMVYYKDFQSMTDDSYYSFTPNSNYGMIFVHGRYNFISDWWGQFRYSTDGPMCVKTDGYADMDATTGALNGTTGVDGHITVSTHSVDGKIYIENRRGGATGLVITVL